MKKVLGKHFPGRKGWEEEEEEEEERERERDARREADKKTFLTE